MTKPSILLTRKWPECVERHLSQRYNVITNEDDHPLELHELSEALDRVDALCPTVSDNLPASLFERPNIRCRLIANYGVGFNHIDVAAAVGAGLVVTNTPDVLTDATADLAMTLMLMASRRTGEGERELRAGQWVGWRPTHLLGRSLNGKTLGLVGFGRIAQATALRAHHGFGMKIRYFSKRRVESELEANTNAIFEQELGALLRESDFVSLHVPGGIATRHMIDNLALEAMRPTAYLINTARGDVIDESALAHALKGGRLAGAGLDVHANEPFICPELLALDNVVLLPHLGSATVETRTAMGMRVAANLDAFFGDAGTLDRIS